MNDTGELLAARVHVETYRAFAALGLPPAAELDVDRALREVPLHSQRVLFEAAADAGLSEAQAVPRLASLWSLAAAINVMDDISDGDCVYLPARAAPGTQMLLHALAMWLAAAGGVSASALQAQTEGIMRMAAGQNVEVRTQTWSAQTYVEITAQVAGAQYAAHLALLWSGTPLESRALELGRALGMVGMIAKDTISIDQRLTSLSAAERRNLGQWAGEQLRVLKSHDLRCVLMLCRYADSALQALSAEH